MEATKNNEAPQAQAQESNEITVHNANTLTSNADSVVCDGWTIFRGIFLSCMIAGLILNGVYGFVLSHGNVECIYDMSFDKTKALNDFFARNKPYKNGLLIASSLCVDINLLYMSVIWMLFAKSWRLAITLFIFYFSRGVCQQLFQMRYPEGYLWEYPGFPSISVSYLKTNDFFFSGHVGFPTIFAVEHYRLGNKKMMIFCVFTIFLEAFTMIATHGHYIIDLFAGVIIGHYLSIVSKYLCDNYVDNSIIGFSTKTKEDEIYAVLPQDDKEEMNKDQNRKDQVKLTLDTNKKERTTSLAV